MNKFVLLLALAGLATTKLFGQPGINCNNAIGVTLGSGWK
jgi:hypothetical protein